MWRSMSNRNGNLIGHKLILYVTDRQRHRGTTRDAP